jgi:glyoxylase-like metal-dependent hydrolase (beta-lactamase superfamily II)
MELGVVDLLDGDHDLTGELAALPTPGHTPGHMSLAVTSAGERAVLTGDVAVHPAHITEPEWCFMQELDRDAAASQRRQFFGRAARDDLLLVACYFPAPSMRTVVEEADGKLWWVPADGTKARRA